MLKIVGVCSREGSRVKYYNARNLDLPVGTDVIADTGSGLVFAQVVMPVHTIDGSVYTLDITPILRIATDKDRETQKGIEEREKNAIAVCSEKITDCRLDMKLVSCEIMFDNSKIVFYFTSEHRVDFRNLVKDLASEFKMRIELRQIGVRDEACMIGGLGVCGRPLCCGTFLDGFASVSIKMAKVQNLSLNPTKISGVCGRLMCCLKYEQSHYDAVLRVLPKIGKEIDTPEGKGTVVSHNVLKEMISVRFTRGEDSEIKQFTMEALGIEPAKIPLEDDQHSKHKQGKEPGKKRQHVDEYDRRLAQQLEEDEQYISEEYLDEPIGVLSNRTESISDYLNDADYDMLFESERENGSQDYDGHNAGGSAELSVISDDSEEPNFTRIQKKNRKPNRHDRKKNSPKRFSAADASPQIKNTEKKADETVKPHAVSAPTEQPEAIRKGSAAPAESPVHAPSVASSPVSAAAPETASDNKASSWQEALKRAMNQAGK